MDFSRRDLAWLLPLMKTADSLAAELPILDGKAYKIEAMPWHANASGSSKARSIFDGLTTRGQRITMHMTELAPGQAPHPAARQPHEEILVVWQGTIECTINGKTSTLRPGDILYSAYNDLKDWKNVGSDPASYFVISLEDHA